MIKFNMAKTNDTNITVVGAGYVGMGLAALFAKSNNVTVIDIDKDKVDKINNRKPVFKDADLEKILKQPKLNLTATQCQATAYKGADFIVIAAPTDFDESKKCFNTSIIEKIIQDIKTHTTTAFVIIKSTIPVGYTEEVKARLGYDRIIFSPEFLREGRSIYDNLYPSRIIVGTTPELRQVSAKFATLMRSICLKKDVEVLLMSNTEAEAVKMFSNTYLAARVAFFNELDTFAESKNLNARNIIDGMCLDPRIGAWYNNPSFGYGGYCLPKDTKQLAQHYDGISCNMMQAIIESNETRKKFVARQIFNNAKARAKGTPAIGVYRLIMKADSDNFRASAIRDVIKHISKMGGDVFIYEPGIAEATFEGYAVVKDFDEFKAKSDIIVTNRASDELSDVADKVYTRDIFKRD